MSTCTRAPSVPQVAGVRPSSSATSLPAFAQAERVAMETIRINRLVLRIKGGLRALYAATGRRDATRRPVHLECTGLRGVKR